MFRPLLLSTPLLIALCFAPARAGATEPDPSVDETEGDPAEAKPKTSKPKKDPADANPDAFWGG